MKTIILIIAMIVSTLSLPTFASQDPNLTMHTNQKPPQHTDEQCEITGCSGEICQVPAINEEDDLQTTCEYHDYYACYSIPNCVVKENSCGWEVSDEFVSCLQEHQAPDDVVNRYVGEQVINMIVAVNKTLSKIN